MIEISPDLKSYDSMQKEHVPLVAAAVIPAGRDLNEDINKNWSEQVLKLQEEVTQLKRVCIQWNVVKWKF